MKWDGNITDQEKEIIKGIKEMGVFRTPYKASDVSSVVVKAIKTYEVWDQVLDSYDTLINQLNKENDGTNSSKRVDNWCVDTLRKVLCDYYANL